MSGSKDLPAVPSEEKAGLLERLRGRRQTSGEPAEEEQTLRPVPFMQLFRFTTPSEKALMLAGAICAALHGALLPMFEIIFGAVLQAFSDKNTSGQRLVSEIGAISKVRSGPDFSRVGLANIPVLRVTN
jgi:hypothetical protein